MPLRKSSARIPKPLCSRDQRERGAGSTDMVQRCYRRVMNGFAPDIVTVWRAGLVWYLGHREARAPYQDQRPLVHIAS
jgi:hypothetical protein